MNDAVTPHARARGLSFPVLDHLLAFERAHAFLESHWEQKPLHRVWARPEPAPGVFSGEFAAFVEAAFRLEPARVEVIRSGHASPAADWSEVASTLRERNASVRVRGAQLVDPALHKLCSHLAEELSVPVSMNVYGSPAGVAGLDPHTDGHDVFAIQWSGAKRWRIFHPPYPLPLESPSSLVFEAGTSDQYAQTPWGGRSVPIDAAASPAQEATLWPGDLLYVPRGFPHAVHAVEGYSVHATIALRVLRVEDWLHVLVSQAARREASLRRALPIGFARLAPADATLPSVETAYRSAPPEASRLALDELAARFLCWLTKNAHTLDAESASEPRGTDDAAKPLADGAAESTSGSYFERVLPLRYFERAGLAGLGRHEPESGDLLLPQAFGPALRYLAEERRIDAGRIPGIDPRQGRALLAALASHGFLRVTS